jgi:hypothetical protein
MSKYRIAQLRAYGWICVALAFVDALNFLLFYPTPLRAPLMGPGSPLREFIRPILMTTNMGFGIIMPLLLGYVMLELARVHERINRVAEEVEKVRWDERPDGSDRSVG